MEDVERLRKILKKSTVVQVRSTDERAVAKATAYSWFHDRRLSVANLATQSLEDVDDKYQLILDAAERHSSRTKYLTTLKDLKRCLIKLRAEAIAGNSGANQNDSAPDFSPLVQDPSMQKILRSRWDECVLCLGAKACLAATVMMGGLLEAILLARVNRIQNKTPLFTAKRAPKDPKTGATRQLREWMLNDFIQVLSELKLITGSATSSGAVLRDYRNYIHPQRQLSHDMHLSQEDAELFWDVTKNIVRQVISTAP